MQVILTGGNRGIGAQMSEQMRARGDQVVATSRDGSTGAVLDVTNPEQITEFAAQHAAPLDLLICNAGVYLDKGHDIAGGYGAQIWADTFAVNVTAVFLTIQALLPALKQSNAMQCTESRHSGLANGLVRARGWQCVFVSCVQSSGSESRA